MSKYNEDILNHYGIEKATKQAFTPGIPDPRREDYKKFLRGMDTHLDQLKSCILRLEEAARQAKALGKEDRESIHPKTRNYVENYQAMQKTMLQMYKLYQKAEIQYYDAENP